MEKSILCIMLAILISLSSIGMAFATEHKGVEPQGMVAFSSGLTKEDSSYTAWANATTTLPEDLLVGFTLYRVVNGSEVYVTSGSKSIHGTYARAEKFVYLTPGTYKLYSYYRGNTQSDSNVKTYNIR
jgi:hypothetical protein